MSSARESDVHLMAGHSVMAGHGTQQLAMANSNSNSDGDACSQA
jgi:hypothetical protein